MDEKPFLWPRFWLCAALSGTAVALVALNGCQPTGAPTFTGPFDHSIINVVTIGNTPSLTPTTTLSIPTGTGGLPLLGETAVTPAVPGYTVCGTCTIDEKKP